MTIVKKLGKFETLDEEFMLFTLPDTRIIGKEARTDGRLGNRIHSFLDELFNSHDYETFKKLLNLLPEIILDFTCDYDPNEKSYAFIHSILAAKYTEVPEGFSYRDITAVTVAKGKLGKLNGLLTNGARPRPCLHGHGRASEETKGLIPRSSAAESLRRRRVQGSALRY